jgi:subtilisin family serine protease
VDVEELGKEDVRRLARDPQLRALAPVMPTTLIPPEDVSDAEVATTAWGIGAVGADSSFRTGAGVVVAILDTGIDAGHPALARVTLVEEDFTGSGNGDRKGHGTHCAGTVLGRDVDGTRIGARGVGKALIGTDKAQACPPWKRQECARSRSSAPGRAGRSGPRPGGRCRPATASRCRPPAGPITAQSAGASPRSHWT